MGRDYKYIDVDQINEDIEAGRVEEVTDAPRDVLFGTILDLLQLAESEGMSDDEIDSVLQSIIDYRADQYRQRFRLSPKE